MPQTSFKTAFKMTALCSGITVDFKMLLNSLLCMFLSDVRFPICAAWLAICDVRVAICDVRVAVCDVRLAVCDSQTAN